MGLFGKKQVKPEVTDEAQKKKDKRSEIALRPFTTRNNKIYLDGRGMVNGIKEIYIRACNYYFDSRGVLQKVRRR